MKTFSELPTYHKVVIALYITLLPILGFIFRNKISYTFRFGDLLLLFLILIFSSVFLLFLGINKNEIKPQKLTLTIPYASFFAFSEEILFRGIIQNILQDHLNRMSLVIFLSSATFGLAHLLNSAKSLHIKNWNYRLCGLTMLAGIPLAYTFALTGSLLLPTILHALLLIAIIISNKKI